MRKEIEVKAKVGNLKELTQKLKALEVVLSEPIIQNDQTFVDENYGDYGKFQPDKNILRIRETNGKYIFTLKQPKTNEFDSLERETEIADPIEFREALLLMGYEPVVEIHKVRRKAKYRNYEICLDEVKELGSFIEVEKITEDENAEMVQNELLAFLESLGVKKEDRVTNGYDTLIYLKQQEQENTKL
ncbi:class IV adenylate cyclase [Patescibacteria group bacterium]|nr:MAG: class IV adenylate cyclase [Patescibacteria group bacterium]